MQRRIRYGLPALITALTLTCVVACSSDEEEEAGARGSECEPAGDHCQEGLTCAELVQGGHRCFEPLVLRGHVTDTTNREAIADARVFALDEKGVAVTDVARTDAEGSYELTVPALRDAEGHPASTFTLRAAAADYQPFPSGPRVALPIETAEAEEVDEGYVLEGALTDVGLIPLAGEARGSVEGALVAPGARSAELGGVLVVASGASGAYSGLTDRSGNFTVFNVPPGEYDLRAYASALQVETEHVTVGEAPLTDVELSVLDTGTTEVAGNVQLVNAPGGAVTSVMLVVDSTFDRFAARGEAPRGLRAENVSGDFTIANVPEGRYVALAAYENDGLVRDPDTNISGTDFVTFDVTAGQSRIVLPDSFKVTEALATASPGREAPEAVSEKPELVWADDSSEEWYDVRVYDSFGDEVWNALELPAVSGGETASVTYEGPLEPGQYYQFRVTSWRQPGGKDAAPISATEDLRGVFFLPADAR